MVRFKYRGVYLYNRDRDIESRTVEGFYILDQTGI